MRRKTHEEFIDELKAVNQDIEVIGKYINRKTKIKCRCLIDGLEFYSRPEQLLRGNGCPKCGRNYRQSPEEFANEIYSLSPDVELLSDYINYRTKLDCRCKRCGFKWTTSSGVLKRGHGCPRCVGHISIKTHEMFIEEMQSVNPDIEILSEYEDCMKNISCRCRKCGNEWQAMPNNLRRGTGCPVCKESKGEKRIAEVLEYKAITYLRWKTFDDLIGVGGKNLSYDFYLPDYNALIEFQGQFHDGKYRGGYMKDFDYDRQQEHDQRKYDYAKSHGIKLIEIWYYEFDKILEILNRELNIA